MASIQEVSTSSKHLSFKIRVCLGRDGRGKQHFKTMKWHPPEGMTPDKARKEVQRVAAVWEAEQLASADLQEVKVEESTISYTFGRFVDEVWIPLCVRDGSHRPSTVAMYTNILKVMRPHFEEQPLAEITGIQISKYLTWLRNDYRTNFGKPLADKSIKHHYNIYYWRSNCSCYRLGVVNSSLKFNVAAFGFQHRNCVTHVCCYAFFKSIFHEICN